jgi:hypothetical protein
MPYNHGKARARRSRRYKRRPKMQATYATELSTHRYNWHLRAPKTRGITRYHPRKRRR